MISRELPAPLQAAIDELVRAADRSQLEAAAARLTAAYRQGGVTRPARTRDEALAYVAQRAPATYAAAVAVLAELRALRPDWRPRSLLDAGAGPGTASWAARAVWPELERFVLVEPEPEMIALGRKLGPADVEWVGADLDSAMGSFDLVLAGYVLNELPDERVQRVAVSLWARASDTLVALEPGTPPVTGASSQFARRCSRRAASRWRRARTMPSARSRPRTGATSRFGCSGASRTAR